MKIGVVADSHDNLPVIKRAVEYFNVQGLEWLVHAGDFVAPFAAKEFIKFKGKIAAVYGNNDGEKTGLKNVVGDINYPPRVVEIGGIKLLIAHDIPEIVNACPESRPDVVICGHEHRASVSTAYEKGLGDVLEADCLFLNPGECCGYLSGKCTVALLDLDAMKAEVVEI